MTRQTPGSNRRRRTKQAIAKLYAKQADRRTDWVEKRSTEQVRRFNHIIYENLNVKNMMASASGTVETLEPALPPKPDSTVRSHSLVGVCSPTEPARNQQRPTARSTTRRPQRTHLNDVRHADIPNPATEPAAGSYASTAGMQTTQDSTLPTTSKRPGWSRATQIQRLLSQG